MSASAADGLASLTPPFLVIGWGNELRGDDAAGCRVADAVEGWARHDVVVLLVHQLTPELIENIANARCVIFVDARAVPAGDPADVHVERLTPAPDSDVHAPVMGHHGSPAELVSLAGLLYGVTPEAWLVGVPAFDFQLGAPLSARAQAGVEAALERVKSMLTSRAA